MLVLFINGPCFVDQLLHGGLQRVLSSVYLVKRKLISTSYAWNWTFDAKRLPKYSIQTPATALTEHQTGTICKPSQLELRWAVA